MQKIGSLDDEHKLISALIIMSCYVKLLIITGVPDVNYKRIGRNFVPLDFLRLSHYESIDVLVNSIKLPQIQMSLS